MYYLLIELRVTVYMYICVYIYICTTNIWLCICIDISADLQLPPWIGGRAWPQSCRIKDVHVRLHDACSDAYLCNIMQYIYIYIHNTIQIRYDTIRYDLILYLYIYMMYIYIWYNMVYKALYKRVLCDSTSKTCDQDWVQTLLWAKCVITCG